MINSLLLRYVEALADVVGAVGWAGDSGGWISLVVRGMDRVCGYFVEDNREDLSRLGVIGLIRTAQCSVFRPGFSFI